MHSLLDTVQFAVLTLLLAGCRTSTASVNVTVQLNRVFIGTNPPCDNTIFANFTSLLTSWIIKESKAKVPGLGDFSIPSGLTLVVDTTGFIGSVTNGGGTPTTTFTSTSTTSTSVKGTATCRLCRRQRRHLADMEGSTRESSMTTIRASNNKNLGNDRQFLRSRQLAPITSINWTAAGAIVSPWVKNDAVTFLVKSNSTLASGCVGNLTQFGLNVTFA